MFDLGAYFPITDPTWIFFIVLSIILFAPMIMAKLRIPHIIGMVLAGPANKGNKNLYLPVKNKTN